MNITKNTLKENCKRFAVMMLAAFLAIIPLTSVNVYADAPDVVYPLEVYNEGATESNFQIDSYRYETYQSTQYYWTASAENLYYVVVKNGSNGYVRFFVCPESGTYTYKFSSGNVINTGTKDCNIYNSQYNLYTSNQSGDGGQIVSANNKYGTLYGENIPIFDTVNDALNAVRYYVDNPITAAPIYSTYDIENGYLSVIDLGQSGAEYEVTLSTEMPMLSEWLTGKFRYSNQTYWFADSWPTTETQIPNSGATLIEWERYGNRNYMGQTKNATATLTGTSSGRYMYIYNPAGQPNPSIIAVYQANMSMMENNTVHVTVEGSGLDIRVYNSQGSYSASVGGVSGSIVADDDYGQATTTTSGGAMQMTVSGGGIYTQTSGGANDVGLVQSVQNYLDGMQSTLTQFMNNVVSLLTTPIEYISSLIQQGGTFVTNIGQFWNWLPSPLPQYLITAVLVVISIGIFHTFL